MPAVSFNPGFALLIGAALVLAAPARARSWLALAVSLGALALAFTPSFGEHGAFAQIGLRVAPLRLDALSQTFGMIFALVAIMLAIHGGAARSRQEEAALLVHAGGALGAVYAGDLVAFVALAEVSTLGAAALLLSRQDAADKAAGLRLIGWQALSSVLFLAGAAFVIAQRGSAEFAQLSTRTPGGILVLLALGVKAGFPIAHVWLKDAAPRASAAGATALLAFTPLLGAYGLARAFAGEPALIWIGVAMTVLPAFHAMAEDDLRRALAYGMTVQVGFIVACIGVGSPLAIAAGAAHAMAAGLGVTIMAMSLGAVLERMGTTQASRLGGLGRTMPVTAALACIAGLSIAGGAADGGVRLVRAGVRRLRASGPAGRLLHLGRGGRRGGRAHGDQDSLRRILRAAARAHGDDGALRRAADGDAGGGGARHRDRRGAGLALCVPAAGPDPVFAVRLGPVDGAHPVAGVRGARVCGGAGGEAARTSRRPEGACGTSTR